MNNAITFLLYGLRPNEKAYMETLLAECSDIQEEQYLEKRFIDLGWERTRIATFSGGRPDFSSAITI